MSKWRVLVVHPGRQHSHQVALALQSADMLVGYWAGIPCLAEHARGLPMTLRRWVMRHGTAPLSADLVRWNPIAPLLRKTAELFLPVHQTKYVEYMGYTLFDKWVARNLVHRKIDAVIAYENSALATFKAAKRAGIMTILDAASIHHAAQDRMYSFVESPKLHKSINQNKDEEIAFADNILTVSELARKTYLDAGVAEDKVHSLMLGADIKLFIPPGRRISRNEMFTFLFAGTISILKGIDILLNAFNEVSKKHHNVKLKLIGGKGNGSLLLEKANNKAITVLDYLPQTELVKEFQTADCFVLPSRFDSYGMVVSEALACGLPVIVSEMVGAKDIVTAGENGWIVPVGDVQALTKRMTWCVENREVLKGMQRSARNAAMDATWAAYHGRLVKCLQTFLFTGKR